MTSNIDQHPRSYDDVKADGWFRLMLRTTTTSDRHHRCQIQHDDLIKASWDTWQRYSRYLMRKVYKESSSHAIVLLQFTIKHISIFTASQYNNNTTNTSAKPNNTNQSKCNSHSSPSPPSSALLSPSQLLLRSDKSVFAPAEHHSAVMSMFSVLQTWTAKLVSSYFHGLNYKH